MEKLDFLSLWKFRFALFEGLVKTLYITTGSICAGLVLGLFLALALRSRRRAIRWPALSYLELMRDLPLVVLLFWIHFVLPVLTGISTSATQSGVLAITLQSSAYLADVARAGIQSIPNGQWDAAHALGLPQTVKWRVVILPQALRIVIPPLANIAIGYFKASSILAFLSVGDLMTVASRIANYSFRPIETLTVVGVIYIILGAIFSQATYALEGMFKKSGRLA